jgi:aspartate carbamoyltransferase catalytic subunit
VINAGDGGHEHPSQTLLDLYTLKKERKTLDGLKIALWGDLKYGRTVHSLAYALARFGATIHFRPSPGFEMPEHVIRKLTTEYTGRLERYNGPKEAEEGGLIPLDAIYVTPSGPHQLANIPAIGIQIELEKGVDALYVTRLQKERLEPAGEGLKKEYPVVDRKLFKGKGFKETIVMHPLPRVGELAYEMDADPRSMYFKQAARGVPIRMALLSLLLGAKKVDVPEKKTPSFAQRKEYPVYKRDTGIRCRNKKCVSGQETEREYMKHEFQIVSNEPLTLRCVYCEHEIHPPYIASSKWHQGIVEMKRYYKANSFMLKRIRPENLIIFDSEDEAKRQGFKLGKRGKALRDAK